jgi:SAM-dependent methyltransferase
MTTSAHGAMTALQWQLAPGAVLHYEQVLVPAYVGPAADALIAHAALGPGESVLDVGCGTGVATRAAKAVVGADGTVVGIDVNRYMLDVARTLAHDVAFREGDARALPVRDHSFDVALCAHTLQFIADRPRVCAQLARVVVPGGRVVVSAWESLDRNPYYAALADALLAFMGPEVAFAITSACTLGSAQSLDDLLTGAGLVDVTVDDVRLDVHLGDLSAFIPRHISSTPMAIAFRGAGEEAVEHVIEEVERRLDPGHDRDVRVPFRTWVATGHAPLS